MFKIRFFLITRFNTVNEIHEKFSSFKIIQVPTLFENSVWNETFHELYNKSTLWWNVLNKTAILMHSYQSVNHDFAPRDTFIIV